MKPLFFIRLGLIAACLTFGAIAASAPEKPFPRLHESFDRGLQRGLESVVADLGLGRAADSGTLALALVDITVPEQPRVAAVNGDRMIYAASLPKIAILLGAFEAEKEVVQGPDGLYRMGFACQDGVNH